MPLQLDKATIHTMRVGTALKLKAAAVNGTPVNLSISLKGFAAAVDRLKALQAS
jgi:invasion protein IalB